MFTFRKKRDHVPSSFTQELKGFAILTIIFGHIGYFLSSNQQFLFPFSIMMGVGVNLFLFLSGYGITSSQITKDESKIQFYKRRLLKLFVPFWTILAILISSSYLFLGKTYSFGFLVQSFLGIFTDANIFTGINSPFWYFTFIVFCYLIFPLVFNKKRPWVSAILLYGITLLIVKINPLALSGVIGLYKVHLLAFPLGILTAWFIQTKDYSLEHFTQTYKKYSSYLYPTIISILFLCIGYFSIHSGVGQSITSEESRSLLVVGALLVLFLIKKRESKLLSLFGLYSYEIYLFHWPLLYYYDFLYKYMPAWIATIIYLIIFVLLGILFQKISVKIGMSKHSLTQ